MKIKNEAWRLSSIYRKNLNAHALNILDEMIEPPYSINKNVYDIRTNMMLPINSVRLYRGLHDLIECNVIDVIVDPKSENNYNVKAILNFENLEQTVLFSDKKVVIADKYDYKEQLIAEKLNDPFEQVFVELYQFIQKRFEGYNIIKLLNDSPLMGAPFFNAPLTNYIIKDFSTGGVERMKFYFEFFIDELIHQAKLTKSPAIPNSYNNEFELFRHYLKESFFSLYSQSYLLFNIRYRLLD